MDGTFLLGNSEAFAKTLLLIEKFAKLQAPVLIEGETGTGKDLAARAIHYRGPRRDGPFVPVNCGAFPDTLVESELFGYLKGAFTDARADRPGLVDAADRGTLFLDEVDGLSPKAQVTLLRFLQDGTYRPIGSRIDRQVDVRIVAASNADLDQLAETGAFRKDLLYRLRILGLRLPPLRERGDDALLLARAFLDRCRNQYQCPVGSLDEASCDWFGRYQWPGNVRELEGLVYREAMTCDDDALRLAPPTLFSDERRRALERRRTRFDGVAYATAKSQVLQQFDRQYLAELMERAKGNVTRAARIAGKERRALGKLLKKHGLSGQQPG